MKKFTRREIENGIFATRTMSEKAKETMDCTLVSVAEVKEWEDGVDHDEHPYDWEYKYYIIFDGECNNESLTFAECEKALEQYFKTEKGE